MLGRLAVVPDLSGALYLPDERTLVVADLHLEKGSAYAARGVLLPPYDSTATLQLLGAAILRYQPARVIALGDSFHDRGAEARIDESCLVTLRAYQAGRDWLWINGNHDPAISAAMGGTVADELDIRGARLRHEPSPAGALPEIAGHLHPAAKVRMRGRALRRRCFALSASRCVMPAMGAYAGGLNVRDAAFRPLFGLGFSAHLLGDGRLFRIDQRLLLPD
ncbi:MULTISPECIES: ligase-associated DNA damage response endonuclease PdeM [unclassified Bosea (in: a-proteobacteria)]|uniref:ligase-associated DNA damage response endonuclease PdeM n=1 Tax=unclassified Bosea (in: a-proteobacteria) TaxID=2653178 RepID=UPI000F7539DC|nr:MULTISPECIES: ligase-associated DNA damage response endonuclease PdeM [unclassified Bosea (in: a-proteobacteria)]AZO81469.1 phosphoesterase [Bosea sp. Tri-49]RXT27751.1 phosphoesterase [Bosea sp. Tri-39]RXT36066.1 phosphoesterase [Bosea sp. Tri-54]